MRALRRLIFTLTVLGSLTGCFGNISACGYCGVAVENQTPFYLHLLSGSATHLYVEPGQHQLVYEGDDPLIVVVAPGQDQSARIDWPVDCYSCDAVAIVWNGEASRLEVDESGCDPGPDGGG